MSRILNRLARAMNPLVLLAGGVVIGLLIAVSINQVISDAE